MRRNDPHRLRANRPSALLAGPAAALLALAATPALATGDGGGIGGTSALSVASTPAAGPDTCAVVTRSAEISYGIPAGLMTAISTVESGRYDPALQANLAWPWTINAEGSGSHFDSKADAVAEVTALLAGGMESIDVGCMQINLRWHPDAFASLDDAFDPAINADYAARLLLQLFEQHGDWPSAIGYYHSPTDWRQENYQAKVAEAWAGLGGSFAGLPVAATDVAAAAPSGPMLFGGLVAAGGPGSAGGAIAATGSLATGGLLLGAAGPSGSSLGTAPSPILAGGGQVTALTGPGGIAAPAAAETLRFFPLDPR
jgi:hypothetical protein